MRKGRPDKTSYAITRPELAGYFFGHAISHQETILPMRVQPLPLFSSERLPLLLRLFLVLRWQLTPYAQILAHATQTGKALDIGCGHGLLIFAAQRQDSALQWTGMDHDAERVRLAQNVFSKAGIRAEFSTGSLPQLPGGPYSTITCIDVMHYFSVAEQKQILAECFAHLVPGGKLLLREIDPNGGLVARLNRAYEKVSTSIGFTRSQRQSEITIHSTQQWEQFFKEAGFAVFHERCSAAIFSDVLFVAAKD